MKKNMIKEDKSTKKKNHYLKIALHNWYNATATPTNNKDIKKYGFESG